MKSVCLWSKSKRMNLKSIAISLSLLMTEASWCWRDERCSWSFVLWSRCQVLLITSQQPHYEPVLASHWSLLTSPGLWLVNTRVLMPPWLTDNVHIFSKKLLLRPEERNNQPHFISHPTFPGSRILLLKVYTIYSFHSSRVYPWLQTQVFWCFRMNVAISASKSDTNEPAPGWAWWRVAAIYFPFQCCLWHNLITLPASSCLPASPDRPKTEEQRRPLHYQGVFVPRGCLESFQRNASINWQFVQVLSSSGFSQVDSK